MSIIANYIGAYTIQEPKKKSCKKNETHATGTFKEEVTLLYNIAVSYKTETRNQLQSNQLSSTK